MNQAKVNLIYFVLLIVLALTIASSFLSLGAFSQPVAVFFSTIKATLVLWFYMDLKKSSRITLGAAMIGLVGVGVMITLILSDYWTRGNIHILGK